MWVRLPPAPQMSKLRLPRKDFKWDPNMAYSVGLIVTDGNLSKDGRHIIMTSTDKELLKTFRSCLDKRNKITINPPSNLSKKTAYHIQIGDVVFYDWLLKIGLCTNKSLKIGSLKIDKKYFPDFLRGHLDGDGSITFYKDSYNTYLKPQYIYDRLIVRLMSASKKHIDWLRKNIFLLSGLKGSLSYHCSKSQKGKNGAYVLKFSTKEAKKMLNWVYYDKQLPHLKRKYDVAKQFLINK